MKIQGDPSSPVPVHGVAAEPLGYFQGAVTGAAQTLAQVAGAALPAGARYVLLRVAAADARWRDDGVAPTATVGMALLSTDQPLVYDGDLAALQVIAQSGAPVLSMAFYA